MSANDAGPLVERVQNSYKRLSEAATKLNAASDELGKFISALDSAFKVLNLGVVAWVTFNGDTADNYDYWSHDVGYDKIDGKWGIAIRATSGNRNYDVDGTDVSWLFNDAPRTYRLQAIDYIPELIEKLVEAAATTTDKINRKMVEAKQLAEALAPAPQPRRK